MIKKQSVSRSIFKHVNLSLALGITGMALLGLAACQTAMVKTLTDEASTAAQAQANMQSRLAPGANGNPASEMFKGHEAVYGEVLVKFKGGAKIPNEVSGDADTAENEQVGGGKVYRVKSKSKKIDALITQLKARPDVEYAEPNYVISINMIPNDPSFPNEWAMQNTGQTVNNITGIAGDDIKATVAWNVTTGGTGAVVAVADTGVDYTHPDLAANVWSAPSAFSVTVAGRKYNCAAGTHGVNILKQNCDPMDDKNHGTHIAGIVGAAGNNSVGVSGLNQRASIMGLKFLDSTGSGTVAGAINAIEFAIQVKAKFGSAANVRVLNNSYGFGTSYSQSFYDEISKANTNNMLFVAAAGNYSSNNDTTPFYPASYALPNVVAVSMTSSSDELVSASNYGPTTVAMGAPGVAIYSTVLNGAYGFLGGTSVAAPFVVGAAALRWSACPSESLANTKAQILATGDALPSLAGKTITGMRLNVGNLLNLTDHPCL